MTTVAGDVDHHARQLVTGPDHQAAQPVALAPTVRVQLARTVGHGRGEAALQARREFAVEHHEVRFLGEQEAERVDVG